MTTQTKKVRAIFKQEDLVEYFRDKTWQYRGKVYENIFRQGLVEAEKELENMRRKFYAEKHNLPIYPQWEENKLYKKGDIAACEGDVCQCEIEHVSKKFRGGEGLARDFIADEYPGSTFTRYWSVIRPEYEDDILEEYNEEE